MSGHRPVAPCGTKPAQARHRRRGETCETCQSRTLAPCGTYDARRRHAYNNETCDTCAKTARKVAPCGTRAARRRHVAHGETCQTCAPKPRTLAPCGTHTAYKRGCRCDDCREAMRAHDEQQRRNKGIPARQTQTAELIEEIEHLLRAGEGEHRILQATGYTGRADALQTRLRRHGRNDIYQRIFTPWELAA